MKAISRGLNLGSEFNPEKLCSEMKGTSAGLNQDVGPSSTPKNEVQRWKPSVGGWTSGLSSTPKSCAQRWKVPVRVEQDVGRGSTPKSEVQRWKPSVGVWTSGLSSTPKSYAQRWKVRVGGWTRMWVAVQPRKVSFRDESHQWGVEPRGWVQPQKVVLRYQWWVEPRVLVTGGLNRDVGPSPTPKRGKKNIAGSFRIQTPIQFLRGSFYKWFLSGSVPRGSRILVRIDS